MTREDCSMEGRKCFNMNGPKQMELVRKKMKLHIHGSMPVLHDWCNKGCGMCYPVCGMVHIKTLAVNPKE